jgi:hypothetical protein
MVISSTMPFLMEMSILMVGEMLALLHLGQILTACSTQLRLSIVERPDKPQTPSNVVSHDVIFPTA